MVSATFIFRRKEYDDEFFRLDGIIDHPTPAMEY